MTLVTGLIALAAFLAIVVVVILTVIWAVEKGLTVRWKTIKDDFARLTMALDGLDTLRERVEEQSEQSAAKIEKAVKVVQAIKGTVDDHERRLGALENHPLVRKLGGPGMLEGA